jgi:hypothetical protein
MQEIVTKKLLADVHAPDEQARFTQLLSVLSHPRRFNITLAQDLIEKFAPQSKLESSFAYITLPNLVNDVTNVLTYELELAGYCIDGPIRNLFLLHSHIVKPEEYKQLHTFLAEQNESFVQTVGGLDRIRYLREFLFHLACYADGSVIEENITHYIKQLAQPEGPDERALTKSLTSFLNFYEEFRRDIELQEALEHHTQFVFSFLYRSAFEIYRQIPENLREPWLRQFFSFITGFSQKEDFHLNFVEGIRHIVRQISREEAIKLFLDLLQDEQLLLLLGDQLEPVRTQVMSDLLDE